MSSVDIIVLSVGGLAALFTALSGFFMWRNGTSQVSSDVITTYKTRVEQLEERVKTCEGLHRENLGEIGQLKGILQEKDKRIDILERVDMRKNPELIDHMAKTNEVLVSIKDFFDGLKEGKYVLTKQN